MIYVRQSKKKKRRRLVQRRTKRMQQRGVSGGKVQQKRMEWMAKRER
jgi:hypothetical protein